jgi:monovalent cation:H+ antiporter-2, CPA2 family
MEFTLLKDLVLLFGLALITVVLFRQLKLPSIIGFLCTGIVAGPHMLGLITDTHQVEQMAEIGVVLLLFTIGIEFSLKELLRIKQLVIWGGGLQVGLTIAAVMLIGLLFGISWQQAAFFGFLVSLSSTAILMKLLMDAGQMDAPHGKICLGILIFQDLCVVPLMLFTPFLGGAGDGLTGILMVSAKALVVVVIAHFSARFAVPWIFNQVVRARSRELFILTIIFVGFGTAFLTAQVGLSLALGAFIAGLAISESEYSHQVMGDIIPFRDAFISLFFISVGMLLDPSAVLRHPVAVLLIVLAILLIKWGLATGTALALGFPPKPSFMSGLMLAQVGEFAFVLSHVGQKYGLLNSEQYQIFLAASVATMALTPFSMHLAEPLATRISSILPAMLKRGTRVTGVSHDRFPMDDHVIIVGFGINGKNLARVLNGNGISYIAVESNHHTVKAERKKGTRIIFGDASRPEILSHALIEKARCMVIAISDATATRRVAAAARQIKPSLHLIARTRYVAEMEPLYQLGVNDVVPEEFETSVEIFARVLRNYLVPHDQIEHCIAEIRRDSYQMFRTVSRRHSHATGISGYLSGVELATYRVRAGAPIEGTMLKDGLLRDRSGATALVVKRGEQVHSNPEPDWRFEAEDIVLILGKSDQQLFAAHLFEG